MYTKILSQTDTGSIVTLAQAKANLNIDDSFTVDDDLIQDIIDVSTELAQTYTYKLITTGQVKLELDGCVSWINLPWGNVSEVLEVRIDNEITDDYTFSDVTQKLKLGSTVRSYANLQVTYNCGYTETPKAIKRGILIMVNTFYTNRESFILGYNVNAIPLSAQRVLDAVKNWKV